MKKLFLSLVAALMAATATFAQSTLVATLTHGENVTMYYGTYALRDAHNAAASGDVINLSGGGFQAVNITKAVTLRGTGIDSQNPTVIANSFDINISETDSVRLSMEGIRCTGTVTMESTLTNAYFLKCLFSRIQCQKDVKKVLLTNCKVTNSAYLSGNIQFVNSFVRECNGSATFVNCIVSNYHNGGSSPMTSSLLVNCIIFKESDYYYNTVALSESSVAYNCVAINYSNNYFDGNSANSNCSISSFAEIFKTYRGGYSNSETFEMTDSAKEMFLGNDNTQIGMYGGMLPYTSTPSYPQITKMNVANKTTADGKLSVEIEVSAAQ